MTNRTYPPLPVEETREPRQMVPNARLPKDVVTRAYKIMKRRKWTVTRFIEKAWTRLVEEEEAKDQDKK